MEARPEISKDGIVIRVQTIRNNSEGYEEEMVSSEWVMADGEWMKDHRVKS